MQLVDTHCHLNFESYDEDRDAVVQRAAAAGVTCIIVPAIDLPTCHQVLELCAAYPAVKAALGVHPNSTAAFTAVHAAELRALLQGDPDAVVAVGEIGLDYYWDKSPRLQQWAAFEEQLTLAAELELPVIIHNRDAGEDVLRLLESWAAALPSSLQGRPGVLHSFSALPQIAERALAAGFYLGFTGPVTYKKADDLRAIVRDTPAERILIETDGPFLAPQQHRGKRNEPAYVQFVLERIAALKQLPDAEMARITTANASRLFALSGST